MIDVIEQTDKLIDVFYETDFVQEMINLKNEIIDNNLSLDDDAVKEYIKNQNMFDFHIYYLNKEIDRLINNKVCRSNNESN